MSAVHATPGPPAVSRRTASAPPSAPLRLGDISFLNRVPLRWGLADSGAHEEFEMASGPPEWLAEELLAGRLDAGPVSLVRYLRHTDAWELLPGGVAVGSDGPVHSCHLVSRAPLENLDGAVVALSEASRTTALLARILLEDVVGVRPGYSSAPQDLDLTPKTRAVFLCEPNNPTGTAVGAAELERFLDRVPGDVLVVLDEAYFEFYCSPDAPDGVELHHGRLNLLTLRTFSKAYGLAGLRVGYGVTQPAIAEALRKCAVPCGVGRIAEEAALTSLRVEAELFERVGRIVVERERTREALLGLGWEVLPSETNFLWLSTGEASEAVAADWERRGLLVRAFPGSGLRVTVGSPGANDLLITAAKETTPPAR